MKSNNIKFPKTRYQGSKLKILDWVHNHLKDIPHETFLDAFSGTSCVSHIMKKDNKKVISNDIMICNYWVSCALVENQDVFLTDEDISFILNRHLSVNYKSFIFDNFKDIYYTDEENIWLDTVIQNINMMENKYKKALALWALFQSCIIKRPYNLFHRKNLHIRTADVERSFGNKTTWDKPFNHFFQKFAKEGNEAVFSSNVCSSSNKDILMLSSETHGGIDLVYLDPPYIPEKGSITTYADFYHFLNGLCNYNNWDTLIDYNTKNLKIKSQKSIWEDKNLILDGFNKIFLNFKCSHIALSYRSDGIPNIECLVNSLSKTHCDIKVNKISHQYALSKNKSEEVLIIAKPKNK